MECVVGTLGYVPSGTDSLGPEEMMKVAQVCMEGFQMPPADFPAEPRVETQDSPPAVSLEGPPAVTQGSPPAESRKAPARNTFPKLTLQW